MSRTNKLAGIGTNTSIRTESGWTIVRYHLTDIVRFNATTIILNSGGWITTTTVRKMNQAAQQFSLGYSVNLSGGKRVRGSNNLLHKVRNPSGARMFVTHRQVESEIFSNGKTILYRGNPLPESPVEAMASTDTE
jgi:hypothetical protein